ncbi:uncharacterized protein N7511_001232 [Penicillium nucicola]|uniref:uncharacterized protein n=1 Tax=Penicillium nucicola TaxID=1850975 RepID=UPI002544D39B|nr:uncharacterized protein N7511_001232 [Penicillium nucicola]KAJ5776221.1 hypothetical protein N7511_001232 [Penicillium nucicola]
MARNVCLGAAQDTIISLYQGLMERSLDENLSRYYHRVIAAALVILTLSCDISAEEKTKSLETCSKSIKLFESMKFGCPEKGIALVQSALALLSP